MIEQERTIEDHGEIGESKITMGDIMSFKDYIEREEEEIAKSNENGVDFYNFDIDGRGEYEGKRLTYYGARHLNDPENEMFNDIEERFSGADSDIVFVEGYRALNESNEEEVDFLKNATKEEVIKRGGESFFTAKLGADRGVRVESPEPEFKDEVRYLLDMGFSKDHVFAYYFHRMIPQYMRTHSIEERSSENFREFIGSMLEKFKVITNWEDFNYSYEHAIGIGRAIWNEDLDIEKFNQWKIDPVLGRESEKDRTTINDIAAQSSMFRDVYIANKIVEAMKNHNSVFVVYGSAHAVMQEPALRKVIEGDNGNE